MGNIYYLMGKSASGKDSIYKSLLADGNLKRIVIYTTRPQRSGEEDGTDYHFADKAKYDEIASKGRIVEQRVYPSALGPWIYFTVDDGSIDLKNGDYLGIGTLESYLKMREYFGEDAVKPLYIEVEDGERLSRALKRERSEEDPKYREMCRRFLADSDDFSEENLEKAGITRRFENDDLEKCIREIKEFIGYGH